MIDADQVAGIKWTARSSGSRKAVPVRSLAYPYPEEPGRYGRLATLEQVPELSDAALYPVKVTSDRQALTVLRAVA